MKTSQKVTIAVVAILAIVAVLWATGILSPGRSSGEPDVRVAIAPYQDMAMLMNVEPLGLEEKYGVDIDLVSMAWEDLTPTLASAAAPVDVAFASLIQFISQEASLNAGASDPIVFFYPAYVFKGGAFVSFNSEMPVLTAEDINDPEKIEAFLQFRFAAQKTSSYEMLLSELARKVGKTLADVDFIDMGAENGLLAAINGSVDATSAGLTQKNEALRQDGRVVLEMTDLGQVDIAGFIARKSTLIEKEDEINALIKMWVESCAYTLADLDANSEHPLEYLRRSSSTQYTPEDFATALSQEILPTTFDYLKMNVIEDGSPYDYRRVVETTSAYYIETGDLTEIPKNIDMIKLK